MVIEILSNKHLSTRYQILVELAARQPNVQQKDVAAALGITPQAVSEHVKQMLRDGLLITSPRSRLKVSPSGIDWMIQQHNIMKEYLRAVERVIWNIRMSPAIADADLEKGQEVGLVMREGMLYATDDTRCSAIAVTVSEAKKGGAVGVFNIRGIIDMDTSVVSIIEVPGIRKGTLRRSDVNRLKKVIPEGQPIAYLGIEAMAVLNALGKKPDIHFASGEAMVEAVGRGVSPVVVCVDEEIPSLIRHLEDADVQYNLASFQRLD